VNANGRAGLEKLDATAKEIDMTTTKKQADVSRRRLLTGAARHGAPASQPTGEVE
jgi:hypothetical protein